MEAFNKDEKKLLKLISELKPYDVMKIAIDPWGTVMSVNIQNNKSEKYDFKIEKRNLPTHDSTIGVFQDIKIE